MLSREKKCAWKKDEKRGKRGGETTPRPGGDEEKWISVSPKTRRMRNGLPQNGEGEGGKRGGER